MNRRHFIGLAAAAPFALPYAARAAGYSDAAVTVAPGTMAPDGSVTAPVNRPSVCARA